MRLATLLIVLATACKRPDAVQKDSTIAAVDKDASIAVAMDAGAAEPKGLMFDWVVSGGGDRKTISHTDETVIGDRGGWRCTAKISAGTHDDGRRTEDLTAACTKGDLMVRSKTTQVEGDSLTTGSLQIVSADKPIHTFVFGPVKGK
jgi:hypothetical protein